MLPSSLPLSHTWREFLEDVQASFQATDRGEETTRDRPHLDPAVLETSNALKNERTEGMIPQAWTTWEENALVAHDADKQPHHEHPRQLISHFATAEDLPSPSYSEIHGDREGGQTSQDARLDVTNWNDLAHDHFFDGGPFHGAVAYNHSIGEAEGSTPYVYQPSTLASTDAYQPVRRLHEALRSYLSPLNHPHQDHERWLHGDPLVAQLSYDGKEKVALEVLASKGLRSRRKVPLTSEGTPLSIVPFQNVANQIANAAGSSTSQAVLPVPGLHVLQNRNYTLRDYSHLVPLPSLEQLDLVWSLPPFEEDTGVAPWAKTGLTTTKNGQSVKHRTAIYKIKCPSCTSWHKDHAQLQRHAKIHAKDPHAVCILCGMWVQNRPDKFNDHRRKGCCVVYTILVDHGAVKLWTTVYGLVHPRPKQFGRGDHFV